MKQRTRSPGMAGRAPACWQDAVARETTRVKNLRRLCAWLQPLTETTPKLRRGPLLGHCLETLSNVAVSTDESPLVGQPRPGAARSSEQVDRAQHRDRSAAAEPKRSTAQPALHSTPRIPAAKPGELARSIDQSRLSHWAGADTRGRSGQTTTVRQPSEPAIKSNVSPTEMHTDPAAQHRSPPLSSTPVVSVRRQGSLSRGVHPVATSSEAQHVWLERLAQRALRAPAMLTGPRMMAALVAQWAGQLGGQTISMDLLAEWAEALPRLRETKHGRVPADRNPGTLSADQHTGHGDPIRNPRTLSADQHAGHGDPIATLAEHATATSEHAAGYEQARTGAATLKPFDSAARDAAHAEAIKATSPVHIAPPSIAQALPQLLPSQTRHDASPAAAANLAERGAEREAERHDVDLAQLAANVKRILDEEARRYGIDV